jgi:hypothetical protein
VSSSAGQVAANDVGERASHAPAQSWRERLRSLWPKHKRVISAALFLLVVALAARIFTEGASAGSLEASLAAALERDGIRVDPDTVTWLSEDDSLLSTRAALFVASEGEEPSDIWYAEVRPGRDGAILDVDWTTNLTRSAGVADRLLTRSEDYVAFVSSAGDHVEALTVMDLRGEPASLTEDWTSTQRLQNEITNLQESGRTEAFGRVRYQLHEAFEDASLAMEDGHFVLAGSIETGAEGGEPARLVIDPAQTEPLEGADRCEVQALEKGVPGGITWVVDTVRNLSFVGPAPIEWLENRVFAVQDRWNRTRYALFGGGSEETASSVLEDLGGTTSTDEMSDEARALLDFAEAEIGFPPAPLTPLLPDRVEGEGAWIPVVDDPFVNSYPGAPPAFAQTFIRPDAERPYVTVYVTLWDPRQVQLRIVSGTREPESATGERGTGTIPRDPDTTRLLVGAFNGGFQALHGEFGMMADRRVYLPPKPWAASIAVYDDGRVAMGSWPEPNWRGRYFDETLANRTIPPNVVDLRQNLTSLVEDGVYNPWERWWWGAAPTDATEQTFTYRSGMCLTEEGFLAFFWGNSLGPDALGQAMISARCARAMHLDMNSGHCGLELFRPYANSPSPFDAPLPTVGRIHEASEYDGEFPRATGYRIRGRRAVRSMAMRFPRYLARDARDFFYLTLRPVLPGPNLEGEGGAFDSTGLPHAGWPYPFARTRSSTAWVVRIDPRRALAGPVASERHTRVLGGFGEVASAGRTALFARRALVGTTYAVGEPGADDIVLLRGEPLTDAGAEAAIGVDRDGFWVYAEGPVSEVATALNRAGVSSAIALSTARLAFAAEGGGAAPDIVTPREPGTALLLMAEEAPAAEVMFPETEPAPYSVWGYLQNQRVRYRREEGPARFERPVPGEE